jgi:hypothetical protein
MRKKHLRLVTCEFKEQADEIQFEVHEDSRL